MTKDELIARLGKYEWNDVEFKKAQRGVPESAYETVSAFANSGGGRLVFGIQEKDGEYDVAGVLDVDKVQNDFLSALRAENKVNHDIQVESELLEIDGKAILIFTISEAPRQNKPLYLNGDIRRSFIRRGGCDHRCTMTEIERFLRDAAEERWDGQVFDFPLQEAFDEDSLKWYRALFDERNPGHDKSLSHQDFLYQWGYLLRQEGRLLPTRAAILLFGSSTAVHQMLPRPILDVQWIPSELGAPLPEIRWLDRIVFEDNLLVTWRELVARYMQKAEKPFRIDPHTLLREDAPPEYRVFREAAINLLIHQDYATHGFKAVIKFYRDTIQFWNPGDVFGNADALLEPGEKEVRNPQIVAAFRRLGLCEQAGTGMRMMLERWQALGHPVPEYENDRGRKSFEIRLPLTRAIPEVEAQEAQVEAQEAQVDFAKWQLDLLDACSSGEKYARELLSIAGYKSRTGNFKKGLQRLIDEQILELTIPDKPNSPLQKYRITEFGKKLVAGRELDMNKARNGVDG